MSWPRLRRWPAAEALSELGSSRLGLSSVEASRCLSVYGPNVLGRLARLRITVNIVTGDNVQVAAHLCREVGLDRGEVVTGAALEALDDASLLGAAADNNHRRQTPSIAVSRPERIASVKAW